jgi:hypothetical protein
MVFHLFRGWLIKVFGTRFQSSQTYKSPSGGFRSIGGGRYASREGRGPASVDPITIDITFTESEERMMESVQKLKTYPEPSCNPSPGIIMVSNQIDITHETRRSLISEQPVQNTHEAL